VPELTNRINDVLTEYQKIDSTFRYQRKLMPGGTCEATAYACYGYASTCLCLPLGNYHNMQNIDGVLAGKRPARIGPEFVSCDDFHGLVLMLEIIARDLDAASVPPLRSAMEKLWRDLKYVLKPTP
jgi:endoglucanase